MKVIQIVMDEPLLERLDRLARSKGLSRSAFIRRALEATLGDERIQALADAEGRAYSDRPATKEERAGLRALSEAQDRVMAQLASEEEEPW